MQLFFTLTFWFIFIEMLRNQLQTFVDFVNGQSAIFWRLIFHHIVHKVTKIRRFAVKIGHFASSVRL